MQSVILCFVKCEFRLQTTTTHQQQHWIDLLHYMGPGNPIRDLGSPSNHQILEDVIVLVSSIRVASNYLPTTYSIQLIRLGSKQVESFEEHRQLPSVTSSSFTASNFKNEPDLRLRDRFTMPARGNLKKPKKSYYRARVSNGSSDGNMEQAPASPPVITVTAEVHIDSSQALPNMSPSPSPSSTESPSPPPPTSPPHVVVTSEENCDQEPCEFTVQSSSLCLLS